MPHSISAMRTKDPDGRVALRDVATTEPGCILGVALLADTSPASTHDHGHGQRLVTASLSVQMRADLTRDPPARARIDQHLGDWPFVAGGGTIVGGSGAVIASSHTTFVGFDRASTVAVSPPDSDGDVTSMPHLDELASSMVAALRAGRVAGVVGAWRSDVPVDPYLRNRFGVLHGASAYTQLALLAREVVQRSPQVRIFDSHVRFVRPITVDNITVKATLFARSRRLADIRSVIETTDNELLAVGTFTLTDA